MKITLNPAPFMAVMLLFNSLMLFGQAESDFYTETINDQSLEKNLRDDYAVDGNGNTTDSERLQQAIDDVSVAGGGRVYIPEGSYLFESIVLKSNVHLLIEANTVISPGVLDPSAKGNIFRLGPNTDPISNVSVRGVGGRYMVNFPKDVKGMTLFGCGDVDNFLLADFTVNDQFTTYSAIGMSPASFVEGEVTWPRNGVVRNGDVLNSHYGYGLVQTQAASNVLFRNVHCTGGATLRVETGWTKMNDLQIGGVDRIFGRNITCSDGHCAVMIAPHSMHNGSVDVDTAISVSCSAAVKIGGGYVSTKYTNPDLVPGTFSDVKVRNVDATFGIGARLKSQELKLIPLYRQQYLTDISEDGGKSLMGPSISAVRYSPTGYEDAVEISNVKAYGFLCQEDMTDELDENPALSCLSIDTIIINTDTVINAYDTDFSKVSATATVSDTTITSVDTLFTSVNATITTIDSTFTVIDSTIITGYFHIAAIDSILTTTRTMIRRVDVPVNNIDTAYFNMDTTITNIFTDINKITTADTSFQSRDTTFTSIDTTVNITNTTIILGTNLETQSGQIIKAELYPNPVEEYLTIKLNQVTKQRSQLRVYNSKGSMVILDEPLGDRILLQTHQLKPGIYLIQLRNGDGLFTAKFLKR